MVSWVAFRIPTHTPGIPGPFKHNRQPADHPGHVKACRTPPRYRVAIGPSAERLGRAMTMKNPATLPALLALITAGYAAEPATLRDVSSEHDRLIRDSRHGGIPPLVGVHNLEVYHATRVESADPLDKGYTYNHHVDMAIWKGRYYLAWTNGQRDEDVAPAREVYVTSPDGMHWSEPAELFPGGVSTSMRMYFFVAPNGRMLATAGTRVTNEHSLEKDKGGLLVREIHADHRLAPVFTLIPSPGDRKALVPQPDYTTSQDEGFVEACRQLLVNHAYLEQQDLGVLLGEERRMAAYDEMKTEKDREDFGRSPCFYYRKDGAMVGIGKLGYAMISKDDGKTFSALPRATSLQTGDAKTWVQRTSDGRYAMVHNPKPTGKMRFPLVILSSEDGMSFDHMRLLNGDFSFQRYAGAMRAPGLQYTRGVSIFSNDGSLDHIPDMFVAYSSNKEDIFVSRIPVPLKFDEDAPVSDDFSNARNDGSFLPDWNIYSLRWAPVRVVGHGEGHALQLTDGSPHDFAKAVRVFPESRVAHVEFQLETPQAGELEIELRPPFGLERPVKLTLCAEGRLVAFDAESSVELGTIRGSGPLAVGIRADCETGTFRVTLNGETRQELAFAGQVDSLSRLEFRTGSLRPSPARNRGEDTTGDRPLEDPAVFLVSKVRAGEAQATGTGRR